MQGALVSVPATGDVHRLRPIPTALYREAIRFADELGLDPIVGLLDGHRAERLPDGLELFATPLADSLRFQYVEDLERLGHEGPFGEGPLHERPVRVFLPTGPERHGSVRRRALAHFAGRASIVWSDMTGIEILAPGTNKGDAVTWLAASHGIAPGEVAAVGDAANDMEMLQWAGRSAAMGTAPGEVRRCADLVVPPSDELGVLDAFAWFFPDLAPEIGASSPRMHPASRAG
jgi:hydroxymethylpyrimidine pyrophosphatase-like HAD family hydrolase